MTRPFLPTLALLALLLPSLPVDAQTDRELREQRTAAHNERRAAKQQRDEQNNQATREFREYLRELEKDYQQQLRDVDVALELKQVALKAEQQTQIVNAEAEYQSQLSGMFMQPRGQDAQHSLEQMSQQAKAYSDQLFAIKREAADKLHRERIASEEEKHRLLKELDQQALQQAESQGLTREIAPIIAQAIGGELTRQEEQWNDRERKDVARLMERNTKLLAKHHYGERLRAWELANMKEDHRLEWEEKAELHTVQSRQSFVNTYAMFGGGQDQDPQAMLDNMNRLNQEQQLIKVRYKQLKQENSIKRREERRKIME